MIELLEMLRMMRHYKTGRSGAFYRQKGRRQSCSGVSESRTVNDDQMWRSKRGVLGFQWRGGEFGFQNSDSRPPKLGIGRTLRRRPFHPCRVSFLQSENPPPNIRRRIKTLQNG